MLSLLKYTLLTLCASAIVMCWFALVSSQTNAQDLLETVYKPAKRYDYIVDIGTTRDSVGKAFLREWYMIGPNSSTDPIIVRVIKWLLEIVVILWVPMLIYGWIRYIVAAGDEWAQKTARTLMINVVIGIVLALSSLAIVTLTSSVLNDTRLWQTYDQTAAWAPAWLPDTTNPNDWDPNAWDTTIATKQDTQTDKWWTTNNIDIQSNPTKNQWETIQ